MLTENAAVLQYIAEAFPRARLIPSDASGRARVRQWLSFIGTELHEVVSACTARAPAPLRGVNRMRTRAGQIVEARGHVKGG